MDGKTIPPTIDVYGTTSSSAIFSNDLLAKTEYPGKDNGTGSIFRQRPVPPVSTAQSGDGSTAICILLSHLSNLSRFLPPVFSLHYPNAGRRSIAGGASDRPPTAACRAARR